jgi:hypothetical protein
MLGEASRSMTGESSASMSVELVDRMFVPWERLGWEYLEPAPPAPSPEVDRMPVWTEPAPPETKPKPTSAAQRSKSGDMANVASAPFAGCAVAFVGFMLVGIIVVNGFGPIKIGLGVLAGIAVLGAIMTPIKKRAAATRFRRERDAAYAAYERELAGWRERVARHDEAEQRRHAEALRWYPVTPWSGPERVDVFGGTGDGWASLLATLGCSLLHGGASMLLVDFTEQQVGDGLAEFAARQGRPVHQLTLPSDWSRWRPMAGLSADEVAELLADVVHSMRAGTAGGVDGRALDADLLTAVVTRLDAPWTFGRMSGGIRVLRRLHDHASTRTLSTDEVERLTSAIDTVGQTDRVAQELQFLSSVLELLAAEEPDPATPSADSDHDGFTDGGLTILRTTGTHRRRKDVLDRVVFHRVVRALRDRAGHSGRDVVVVAGADHLGRDSLEELVRQAERCGVRLVLMLERLRGEVHELLGGRYSATVLMRLGNAREAAAAAEFVGRGHTFVLSQLTQQVGATFTEGTAATYGVSEGISEGTSASFSDGRVGSIAIPFASGSGSVSVSRSRTETWQDTVNRSLAESLTAGQTVSRVYEFTVEPTTVQSLPATAFVLVEPGPKGRRVVLGDCNPGIALLDRVATEPRKP